MNLACSPITSSLVLPLPALVLGCIVIMLLIMSITVNWEVVISAFSCRPKASGLGLRGRVRMYSR